MYKGLWLTALLMILVAPSARVSAHGSVVDAGEGCTIFMDFYSAHFTVFQPERSGHREYCEDLPATGESVCVMEYLHDSLRQVPAEFRIIRNTTELGRFVKLTDVQALGDLDDITVFYQSVGPQPDGVLTVMHSFQDAGDFIGVVSAPHPQQDRMYHAVFPFSVGDPALPVWLWVLIVTGLLLLAWRYRNTRGVR